jgi:hypothetical protein
MVNHITFSLTSIDQTTSLFHRFEVANGINYGITLGYLLGEHYGIEFAWNRNKADTRAQPFGGFSSVKLFTMTQDQYLGNFLFHLTPREDKLRPFLMFGLGANALDPDVHMVSVALHVLSTRLMAGQSTTSIATSGFVGSSSGLQPT